ncbi:multiple sugar transport system substrate-binding protein [Microbacterium sp. W4I4]|uniref:ABC transporter substrate-binding protein n=1 Tax=Microbacterium sp. W4I4 TaxID=3042295 RepID=UPI002783D149|nr:sugar ABC transporter substrate-binding protein [Microbacterium sp. W4I4]MDQ0614485.1 multiple sugar transport system substrate-binding protein [Microbacterium sp. W4I4]
MKKKTLVAAGAVMLLGLTACSAGGTDAKNGGAGGEGLSGEVTMWYPPIAGDVEREFWDAKIADFTKLHPDVDVTVEIVPWDGRAERLQTGIAGKTTPDVTYVLPADVYSYGSKGIFADVSDVVADDKDDFLPNALETMSVDGALYAVPTLVGMSTTIYVSDVWDAIGVAEEDYPTTFEEVREYAPLLKEKGYYVTQYDAAPSMTLNGSFYPLLWASGGRVLDEDGEVAVNSPEAVEALDFVSWLVDNDYTPRDALTTDLPVETSPIAQGKVAMLFARSVASLVTFGLTEDQLVVGAPIANEESLSYGNVGGYALFEAAADNAAAKEWIRFITSPEFLKDFLPERNQLSPRLSVSDLYPEGSVNAELVQYLDRGIVDPKAPGGTEIMNVLKPAIQSVLLGQQDAQKAMDAAAEQIDGILARSGN